MSWVARLLISPVRIIFLGAVALLLAILVDLAVIHVELVRVGLTPGAERIAEERRVFFETFDSPLLLLDPRTAANSLRGHLYKLRDRSQKLPPPRNHTVNRMLVRLKGHVMEVLPTVEVFSLRVISLIATVPLVAIYCVVAGVDGWVRREVRKAGAGIESARIYHFAKRSIAPLLMWLSLLYVLVPVVVDVRWVYGILGVTIPFLLGITISRFKKYV